MLSCCTALDPSSCTFCVLKRFCGYLQLPIFKALRHEKEKWRALCRVLRFQGIQEHEEVFVTDSQMFVVVLSGNLKVQTVDTDPFAGETAPEKKGKKGHSRGVQPLVELEDIPSTPTGKWSDAFVGGMSKDDWLDVFNDTDADGSGALSAEEIYMLLASCGIDVEFDEIVELVHNLDDDGEGRSSFREALGGDP